MKKTPLFAAVLLFSSLFAALPARCADTEALLCPSCAFGHKKDRCVTCGGYTFEKGVPAQLCGSCSFGARGKYCVNCGAFTFDKGLHAVLCRRCAFGDGKKRCVTCNAYLFD